jgi:hypothetical protein
MQTGKAHPPMTIDGPLVVVAAAPSMAREGVANDEQWSAERSESNGTNFTNMQADHDKR